MCGPVGVKGGRFAIGQLGSDTLLLDDGMQYLDLAHSIDDVAIEVEERMQAINADSAKLAQLRNLLKGIGA